MKNIERNFNTNLRAIISPKNDFCLNSRVYQVQTKASAIISPNLYNFIFMTFKDTVELLRHDSGKIKNSNNKKLVHKHSQSDNECIMKFQNDNENLNELKKNQKRKYPSSDKLTDIHDKKHETIKTTLHCLGMYDSTEEYNISKKNKRKRNNENETNKSNDDALSSDEVLKNKDEIVEKVNSETCENLENLIKPVNSDPLKKEYKQRKNQEVALKTEEHYENCLVQKSREEHNKSMTEKDNCKQFLKGKSDVKNSEKELAELNSIKSVCGDLSVLGDKKEATELVEKKLNKSKHEKFEKHDVTSSNKTDTNLQNIQSSQEEKVTVNRINEDEEQLGKENIHEELIGNVLTGQRNSEENTNEEPREVNFVGSREDCSSISDKGETKTTSTDFFVQSEDMDEKLAGIPEKQTEGKENGFNANEVVASGFPEFYEISNTEKTYARNSGESRRRMISLVSSIHSNEDHESKAKGLQEHHLLSSSLGEECDEVLKQKKDASHKLQKNEQEKNRGNEIVKPEIVQKKTLSLRSERPYEDNGLLYSKEDNNHVTLKKDKKKAYSETGASENEETLTKKILEKMNETEQKGKIKQNESKENVATVTLKDHSKQVVNIISNEILDSFQVSPKRPTEKDNKMLDIEVYYKNIVNQSDKEEYHATNNFVSNKKRKEYFRRAEDSEISDSKTHEGHFDTNKNITKSILRKKDDSVSMTTETLNEKSENKTMSSYFFDESPSSKKKERKTSVATEEKKLRKEIIKAVTHRIEKFLSKDKQNDSSYGVEVDVRVKKEEEQIGINEEILVSYKKCAYEQINNTTIDEEKQLNDNTIDEQCLDKIITGSINQQETETTEQEISNRNDWLTEKVASMRIQLPWPIPKAHQIETKLTGAPTREQRHEIEASGIKSKKGKFTSLEDQIIKNNWKEFCKKYDLPSDSYSFFKFSHLEMKHQLPYEEKLNFVRFLAHGLSDRTLYSVYTRFQRLFNEKKSGRFSSDEDKVIMEYMKNHENSKKPYCHLARVLNRDKMAVFKRHKKLVASGEGKFKKVQWKHDKIEEFVRHLLNVTACNNIEELREKKITTEEWKQISKKIDVSVNQLQQLWFIRLYPRLYIDKKTDISEVQDKLLNILIGNNDDDWRNLNWYEIANEFNGGYTSQYLNRMFKGMVRYHVPKEKQHDLKESVEYLRKTYPTCHKYHKKIDKLDLDESVLQMDSLCDTSEICQ